MKISPLLFLLLVGNGFDQGDHEDRGAPQSAAEAAGPFWDGPNQCAAVATFAACRALGVAVATSHVDDVLPADGRAKSLLEVRDALLKLGIRSSGASFPGARLTGAARIAIVPLQPKQGGTNHFITVLDWNNREVLISTNGWDASWIDQKDLADHWDGRALLLENRVGMVLWSRVSENFLPLLCLLLWATAIALGLRTFKNYLFSSVRSLRLALLPVVFVGLGSFIFWPTVFGKSAHAVTDLLVLPSQDLDIEGIEQPAVVDDSVRKPEGYYGTAEFTIKNRSSKTITLAGVTSNCACAGARLGHTILAPEDATCLTAEMYVSGPSRRDVRLTLAYDDGRSMVKPLTVRLHPMLQTPKILDPKLKVKLVLDNGHARFVVQTLEDRGAPPWLSKVLVSDPLIEVIAMDDSSQTVSETVVQRAYDVKVFSRQAQGVHRTTIQLVEAQGQMVGERNLEMVVPGLIVVEPEIVAATVVTADQRPIHRQVSIRVSEGSRADALQPEVVTHSAEWFDVTQADVPLSAPGGKILEVRLLGTSVSSGVHRSIIRVRTGIQDCPTLEIPVSLTRVEKL